MIEHKRVIEDILGKFLPILWCYASLLHEM